MIFPISKIWAAFSGEDTVGRIDRCLADRMYRLNAGISLSEDFTHLDGCLIVTCGRGKYLRVKHVSNSHLDIPRHISQSLSDACASEVTLATLKPILFDLAETEAALVEMLKAHAGKAVDRILTVSVQDPGYWARDFDGRPVFCGLCDPNRLAELTGITVVDDFPSRDLAAGGTGQGLETLPLWLVFAERNPTVSEHFRAMVSVGIETKILGLPPSDGLDADVPDITVATGPGERFTLQLLDVFDVIPSSNNNEDTSSVYSRLLAKFYVEGKTLSELKEKWGETKQLELRDRERNWIKSALRGHSQSSRASVIHTAIEIVVDEIVDQIGGRSPKQLKVICSEWIRGPLINRLNSQMATTSVETFEAAGQSSNGMLALSAAILGLMHIDQSPASVPWVTGADSQRILGRLTPGRPANWRQLVLDMADYCPPAMKLRDAV